MPPSPRTLGPLARAWRLLAMLLAGATVVCAQIMHSNDLFPFGALDQFSSGTDPDGEVVNTCLLGVRDGESIDIAFGTGTVGIQRAEMENQLELVAADPSLLAPLVVTYDAAHPEAPLDALVLCQRITPLRAGVPHGEVRLVEVARWEAGA